jgi:hypothetical protein
MGGLIAPKVPKVSAPPAAPDPDKDSPLAQEAARRKRAKITGRGGRESTMLTDALGGGGVDFGSTQL